MFLTAPIVPDFIWNVISVPVFYQVVPFFVAVLGHRTFLRGFNSEIVSALKIAAINSLIMGFIPFITREKLFVK